MGEKRSRAATLRAMLDGNRVLTLWYVNLQMPRAHYNAGKTSPQGCGLESVSIKMTFIAQVKMMYRLIARKAFFQCVWLVRSSRIFERGGKKVCEFRRRLDYSLHQHTPVILLFETQIV